MTGVLELGTPTFTYQRPKPEPMVVAVLALARREGGKLTFSLDELEAVNDAALGVECWYTLSVNSHERTVTLESNLFLGDPT